MLSWYKARMTWSIWNFMPHLRLCPTPSHHARPASNRTVPCSGANAPPGHRSPRTLRQRVHPPCGSDGVVKRPQGGCAPLRDRGSSSTVTRRLRHCTSKIGPKGEWPRHSKLTSDRHSTLTGLVHPPSSQLLGPKCPSVSLILCYRLAMY